MDISTHTKSETFRPIFTIFSKCLDNQLSYESRNECRLGRFGQIGFVLKAERQVRELRDKIKRWTWAGRPTRKARRINTITQRIGSHGPIDWERLLLSKK